MGWGGGCVCVCGGGEGCGSNYRKCKWCLERRMKDKLSLNCRGVDAAEVEGVFWCVMDRTGECEKFQSRVDGMVGRRGVGGWGGGECMCDNEGRQRTGQSGKTDWSVREDNGLVSLQVASSRCGGNRARSDLFVFPIVRSPSTPSDSLLLHTNHKMIFYSIHVRIYAVCHYISIVYP